MKSRTFLMLAVLASGLLCSAQDSAPVTTPSVAPTPAQPAAMPALPVAVAPSDTYIIGANDQLAVTVWKEPQLSGAVLVRPDGMISLPLVGDTQATGLTPLQLAGQIATKLKKYVQDPNVSVVVAQIHSKVIYLLGEVNRPGSLELTPNMTVLEAISSAGGFTQFANKKKIYILRDEGGKRLKIPVHYKEALQGNLSFDLVLKSGDTVVFP